MNDAPRPLNRAAYPQPTLGNPVSTLLESGVGNCFPGLEFDLRHLDARFFPGLLFEFPGAGLNGPDGTQGAKLMWIETSGDSLLATDAPWAATLRAQYGGDAGNALSSGDWYLHSVEQHGKRIEMYDVTVYENAVTRTPYEGDTCWWIIRLIEADQDLQTADLTISLIQRQNGQLIGNPVTLKGKRRIYVTPEGMIDPIYQPGELTASMCSPWTHDFTDCACQYWASNHPDVALGPSDGTPGPDGDDMGDPAQSLTFLDWLRRRDLSGRNVSAPTTIAKAEASRYDHYEINQRWEELDFVVGGQERNFIPRYPRTIPREVYHSLDDVIRDLTEELAPLEFTLSMEYLYAYFSLRAPDEVTPDEAARWPTLKNDLLAAREMVLSVALSEMTHMRWVNQILWTLDQAGYRYKGRPYRPVVHPAREVPAIHEAAGGSAPMRPRELRRATPKVLYQFQEVERPRGHLDTEYASLVHFFRSTRMPVPEGLDDIAIRIDSDGMQHFHKFRDTLAILGHYTAKPRIFLRHLRLATPEEAGEALRHLTRVVEVVRQGYQAERDGDMPRARDLLLQGRSAMQALRDEAERLARAGLGVPFFAPFEEDDLGA